MNFVETSVAGAWLVELEPSVDHRGFFARVWSEEVFAERGLTTRFVQCNNAYSRQAGTVRGLHYQVQPFADAKLLRCIRGAVFDVIVDVRPESPTYLQWFGVDLSEDNRRLLYVPPGCAHGYQALSDHAEVLYPVSAPYTASAERGVRWDDPLFGISWPPTAERIVSDKDLAWPNFVPGGSA
jgi:dTDP-4-dehydrorhamnose 3,5-epimerase